MIGRTISRYAIAAELGRGGMGVVYKARDSRLKRFVALKILAPEKVTDLGRKQRFVQEARSASALNHPNIVTIYDIDQSDGIDFIAMEYVEGKTVGELIGNTGLKLNEALKFAIQIADALAKAHSAGIVHRDLKPGNLMVTSDGRVKVLDFGLAKLTEIAPISPEDSTLTENPSTKLGLIVGTVSYMSPEQAEGKKVDARSDIFSFGSVLYEMLTGQRAFRRDSPALTQAAVLNLEPPPLPVEVPGGLVKVIERCLRKDVARRYQHMDDVMLALEELKEELASGKLDGAPAGGWTRARRWLWPAGARRIRSSLAASAMLVVLLAAAVWWIPLKGFRAAKPAARQVVVLPFENLSGQPEQSAFCDGLTEIVAGILSRPGVFSDAFWVLPSSDVRHYGVETVVAAGRMLHADLAIGGSVRRPPGGPAWLIAVSVSDAAHPHLLDSQSIRVEERDAANIDATLTSALVRLLDVRKSPAAAPAQLNAAAYSRFVAARGYMRQYDRGDNLQRAIKELEAITTSAPGFAPAQVVLSEAYYRMYSATKEREWLARADQAVRRGAEINEDEPGIPLMLGRIMRATGQPEAAIHELQAALARDPGNLPALLLLAGAYQDAKRPDEAEATYDKAIRLRPSYFPAYTNLGILYMSQGKWREAEEPLTLVTKLAPDLADGYTSLGSLEYYLDHWDEASRLFSESIRLKPTAKAYSDLCGIEFYQKALEAAVSDCRKAVDMQPADAYGWGNLADALFERGNLDDAAQTYRRALDEGNKLLAINPINPDLMANMAKYAIRTGQKKNAIELAAGALEQGNSVDVLYNAGKAYGFAGDCARAGGLLKQAFDKGFPRPVARRDPDLDRLRAAPLACAVPPLN